MAIQPDESSDNIKGGLVPSINAGGERHFVSPKAASDFVVLKAVGPTADEFEQHYTWSGPGQQDPTDPLKWQVSRDSTGKSVVSIIKQSDGLVADQLNVWIVWCTMELEKQIDIILVETTVDPLGAPLGTHDPGIRATARWGFTANIMPPSIVDNTAGDIPDLTGAPTSNVPNWDWLLPYPASRWVPDSLKQYVGQPGKKWDISRRIRLKMGSPQLGSSPFWKFGENIVAGLPTNTPDLPFLTVAFSKAMGADDYPADPLEGNDDTQVSPPKLVDPYSSDQFAKLLDQDAPGVPVFLSSAGNVLDTVELRAQFKEFVRLEINGKWYLISNPDDGNWRYHAKFIKKTIDGEDKWVNNGSVTDATNDGWNDAP